MNNTGGYKKILVIWGMIFGFLVFPMVANAAVISIKSLSTISVGDRLSVDVLIDPENQSINSVESTIVFSNEILSFNGFSLKQSSIPIWVEEPKEKNKGQIHFSGVVPGGLERLYDPIHIDNKSIPVVRLFFIAKAPGTTSLTTKQSLVLENDGKGTAVSVTNATASITITAAQDSDGNTAISEDLNPPNPFVITFVERSLFGKTPRLALFSAEDNEGGIEHYEVAVGNLGYHITTSPFSLPYRLFPYTLTVRAFDFSGNVRQEEIIISGDKPYGLGVAIALCVAILGVLRYRYIKSKKT